MEREAVYVLSAFTVAGSVSLWSYLRFRGGADRPSQRRAAQLYITAGAPNLPALVLAGAGFWYSTALTGLSTFLPESPVRTAAIGVGVLLVATAIVSMLVWAYRPPNWALPHWYRAELDRAPKRMQTRRHRIWTVVLMWFALACAGSAYLAYRLDAPWYLWVPFAAAGVVSGAGYVLRD